MTKQQILNDPMFKFKGFELVCPHIYKRFGEAALFQLDVRLLEVLLWIRKGLGLPMTINTWKAGGNLSQRGMRCNLCEKVKEKDYAYLSAHTFGQGVDFNVNGMDAKDVRKWIDDNKGSLPHPIRLERKCNGKETTWVHLDIRNETSDKIVYFEV